jgi:hypothetical protein
MPPYKPYVSDKQRRWAHTTSGVAALGEQDVRGKDESSKGLKLPKRSLFRAAAEKAAKR